MPTPADWLAIVAACAEAGLEAQPAGWSGRTIQGMDDAGISQPCCPDGLLRVEWIDTTPTTVVPKAKCRHRALITVRVSIRRCHTAFETGPGGGTTGEAPSEAVVNAEHLQGMEDAWAIWSAITCCLDGWEATHGARAELSSQSFSFPDTCRGSDTFLTIPIGVCCEDIAS